MGLLWVNNYDRIDPGGDLMQTWPCCFVRARGGIRNIFSIKEVLDPPFLPPINNSTENSSFRFFLNYQYHLNKQQRHLSNGPQQQQASRLSRPSY